MAKRIVGVEMDVWTEREVEDAVRSVLYQHQLYLHTTPESFVRLIMERLRGERP